MLVIVETVQDQEEGRREVGCQWESPEGDRREERREVGCQSESAESRDAAVQVDFSWRPAGVWGVPWQCVSVRADEPGGGALLQHCSTNRTNTLNTGPPLYPVYPPYSQPLLPSMPLFRPEPSDLHQDRSLPSLPLYQPFPLLPHGTSPLLQTFPLPSMPLWSAPPTAGVKRDVSPPPTPADVTAPPPGLIAPLSPRLAEDEDEEEDEEGSLLKQGKGVCDNKHSTITTGKKKRKSSQYREKSGPAFKQIKHITGKVPNTVRRKRRPSSTVHQKSSSDKNEAVLHPVESSSITKKQKGGSKTVRPAVQIQCTPADRGKEEVQEEGGGVKPVKIKTKKKEQAGRPRRKMVGPPIRYLLESEVRSYSLSAANHSKEKVKLKMGSQRKEQEKERGGVEVTERTDCRRVESSKGAAADGWCQACQTGAADGSFGAPLKVCGLMFTKEASLQLHLSVHGSNRWFSCHLCNKRFRHANTLHMHHYCHHRGNRGGAHGNRVGHLDNKVTATDNNQEEVEVNTKSDREKDREDRSEEEEEKPLFPAPTMAPDWSKNINRVRRNPWWWGDFRMQTKRRQDSMERWRRLQENGEERKRKRSREEEEEEEVKQVCMKMEDGGEEGQRRREEEEEVKQVCMEEGGGEEGQRRRDGKEEKEEKVKGVHVKEDSGGEAAERRRDEGEEKEEERQTEAKKEVMEPPQRPRRKMVGPPIRYLLESEELSHGPVPAKQDRRKPQKKSVAGGGVSDNTTMTDRSLDAERQTGQTNQDTGKTPKQRRGIPKKVMIDSKAEGGASERETDQMVTDTQTGYVVSERETGHMLSERQMGQMAFERETGDMALERQTDQMVSEKQTGHMVSQDHAPKQRRGRPEKVMIDSKPGGGASERQTDHMVTDEQTGSDVVSDSLTGHMDSERETNQMDSERQTGHMASESDTGDVEMERQTESQTGNKASEGETGGMVSERQTGEYKNHYLVYRDLRSGQVTLILPCCVRLQRLL